LALALLTIVLVVCILLLLINNNTLFQDFKTITLLANNVLQTSLDSNLPLLLQNLGLALLSVLIPLAIVILTEFYQKKGQEDRSFADVDLRVILDTVFQVKGIIVYSLIVFLPFIFWNNSYGFLRLTETILSIVGILLIIRVILRVYKWLKGNVNVFRYEYLKKLDDPLDLRIAWRSVWQSKDIGVQSEIELFRIFSSKIDEVIRKYD
jgi:hypothetical protein